MSVLTEMSPGAPRLSVKCIGSVTLYRKGRERPTKGHKERERRWGLLGGGVSSYRMHNRASNETGMSICPASVARNT